MHARTAITRRVLVIGSDTANSQVIEGAIRPWMFETIVCSSMREAQYLLAQSHFALIISEERFADGTYSELLSSVQGSYKVPIVVMISDVDGDSVFREAMALGAFGVVASPCSAKDVQWMVIQATRSEVSSSKSKTSSRSMSAPASNGLPDRKQ
jgi:DNA-binding NtrC family response regulator